MKLTESAVANPAAVGVVVAMVVLFGLISLFDLPLQLFPDIERPRLAINTNWRAASPQEVEAELLEPQEQVLQGLPNLVTMQANAFRGGSWIQLEFNLETDMQQMLMEVIGRMNRLPPMPADSDPPIVQLGDGWGGGGANASLTWFFIQLLPGTEGEVLDYVPFVDEVVRPRLESIEGVSGVNINMGAQEELQITIDPYRAAELGVQLPNMATLVSGANDVSGGFVDIGRRQYTIRFEGRYDPTQMTDLILEWRDGKPVRLGDIADVQVTRARQTGFNVQNSNPAMGIQVLRENGANVLETLTRVKAAVAELRDGPLAERGLGIEQSFDASVFIKRAVSMVGGNLIIGLLLAIGVLWWFLRDRRATALIATAIPISLFTTIILLALTGRSLNVISLAGLAFAVGMVLDAAIVVAENIVRLREGGEVPTRAALRGTFDVQGALLASTATTVAIFIPVLFLRDVEGQLFGDLALTIAIAVIVSLLVALTILPAVAGNWLRSKKLTDDHAPRWRQLASFLMGLTSSRGKRLGWVAGLMIVPITTTWLLFPQLNYLPPVKRDAVDAFLQLPPGANADMIKTEILPKLVERLDPYMRGDKEPALKNYYILTWPGGGGGTIGARVKDQSRVDELERIINQEVLQGIPDFRGFAQQGNLFGGFGSGSNILIHLQTPNTEALYAAASEGQRLLNQTFPGSNTQAWPEVEAASPELRIEPNDQRITESGWNRRTMGQLVRLLGDGLWLGEYFNGDQRVDMIMRGDGWQTPEDFADIPLVTPSGAVIPLGELVSVSRTTGPGTLRRVDGRRTVTLAFSPPAGVSLETAMEQIETQIEPVLRAALPEGALIRYGGSADSLRQAINTMGSNFVMALLILFMLMAGLFRSAKDSALVMMTIPLAAVGGIVALRLLNLVTFQPMDLLTMIGFIILLGLVVNNAILLVHRTRQAEREGMDRHLAVESALQQRLRPIFMSTMTSIFGMLPLLLIPGQGSVIYRGLAAVIVGGMVVSLFFTLLMLPSLLRMGRAPEPVARDEEQPSRLESVA